VAEVLVEFPEAIPDEHGVLYRARACGSEVHGTWQGWIEFESVDGGVPIRTGRETTQPNRVDTHYWATGLTPVYLEGALHRALHPLTRRPAARPRAAAYDEPAPDPAPAPPATDAVLNPFSVYQKGEALLRRQLSALSSWHLVNIVRAYGLSTGGLDPNRLPPSALIDSIVEAARARATEPIAD
jgi:hypothetical protein